MTRAEYAELCDSELANLVTHEDDRIARLIKANHAIRQSRIQRLLAFQKRRAKQMTFIRMAA